MMIQYDQLEVGMKLEACSPNGEFLPAVITELPRGLPGYQIHVFVAFEPSQTVEDAGVLVRYPQDLRPIGG